MLKLILFEITLFTINWHIGYAIPGIKSIKQCHKYYDLERSLTNLNLFRPMTSEDLDWIRNKDNNETAPAWAIQSRATEEQMRENENTYEAVGGEDAFSWEFPFMAALGYGDANDIQYDCGGSLVSEEYIVTAAHCIFSGKRKPVKYIRLGNVKIKPSFDSNFGNVETITVSNYYVHPNYTSAERYNDIALIKLSRPVTFTSCIKLICLEYERKSLRNKVLYAAGWGLLGHGEDRSNHLQKVTLRQYARNTCQKTYANDRKLPSGVVDDHQICAGSVTEANITDTCEGDSGGPLLYEGEDFKSSVRYLTGVISFGVPCGIAPLPAIYTRVAYYIDWIERIVWPDENMTI